MTSDIQKCNFVQGTKVDNIDSEAALRLIESHIGELKNMQIITINPEMVNFSRKNPEFKNLINNADLVIPDGAGIKLALKFQGVNQKKIRGIDFSRELLNLANEKSYKVALVGSTVEVISLAVENIKNKYKNINIVFQSDGFFTNDDEIMTKIKNSGAQILLCALGSPKQEYFIYKLKELLNGCVMIGVGGSFDVFSGKVTEAPLIFRKLNLEWLYRTILQPERFKRIFPALPLFLFRSIIDSVTAKIDRKKAD